MNDTISESPFFIELTTEYMENKLILDTWHNENSYANINNSNPYPRECLYKMLDILEIMDNAYIYSPGGDGYMQTKCDFETRNITQ